jgi:hypothetical protein
MGLGKAEGSVSYETSKIREDPTLERVGAHSPTAYPDQDVTRTCGSGADGLDGARGGSSRCGGIAGGASEVVVVGGCVVDVVTGTVVVVGGCVVVVGWVVDVVGDVGSAMQFQMPSKLPA